MESKFAVVRLVLDFLDTLPDKELERLETGRAKLTLQNITPLGSETVARGNSQAVPQPRPVEDILVGATSEAAKNGDTTVETASDQAPIGTGIEVETLEQRIAEVDKEIAAVGDGAPDLAQRKKFKALTISAQKTINFFTLASGHSPGIQAKLEELTGKLERLDETLKRRQPKLDPNQPLSSEELAALREKIQKASQEGAALDFLKKHTKNNLLALTADYGFTPAPASTKEAIIKEIALKLKKG
jgi:hypothetical protein